MMPIKRAAMCVAGATVLFAGSACSEILEVDNPNLIDVTTVDPVQDAPTLANSVQQSYASALGWLIMYGSWFTGETLVSETFPTRNEFGRRDVATTNGSHSGDVWTPLSRAASLAHLVLELELPEPDKNINLIRSHFWLGYSFVLMAEQFCEGAVYGGPSLTTANMLDSAVANFTAAIDKATVNATTEAIALANAARVGRARAHLQAGRKPQALADAQSVPTTTPPFSFSLNFLDDPGNRTRVSNRLWQFTFDRGSMSVAPAYQVTDPRIRYKAPGQHTLAAQDANAGPFFIQDKYPAYTSSVRVASKLEADYIAAEAGTVADQLLFIADRRSANSQPAYTGDVDAASVLTELMTQKHRDFWLEGQRFGDFRRNPAAVLNMPVPGAVYFKPGFPPIGNQTCYPLPVTETDNNPNFSR